MNSGSGSEETEMKLLNETQTTHEEKTHADAEDALKTLKATLKTGDLLVCDDLQHNSWGIFSWFIKFMTQSDYSHVGMVVVDPDMTIPKLKGVYVWTSGISYTPDPEDNKKRVGVQFVEFDEFLKTYEGKIYLRRLSCETQEQYHKLFNATTLQEIHKVVYDKPYDIVVTDWIEAYYKKDANPQKTSRFWCSALIGYIYTKLKLFDDNLDWSILTPSYFSSENKTFKMLHNVKLEKEYQIWG